MRHEIKETTKLGMICYEASLFIDSKLIVKAFHASERSASNWINSYMSQRTVGFGSYE